MNHFNEKPWLNEAGQERDTEELKTICHSWDEETWESYLKWKETPQVELPLHNPLWAENLSTEDFVGLLFGLHEKKDYPLFGKIVIRQALNKLTHRQRTIIRMHFWDGKNKAAIARELGISRRSIRVSMEQGLKKMRKMIESGEIIEKIKSTIPLVTHCEKVAILTLPSKAPHPAASVLPTRRHL